MQFIHAALFATMLAASLHADPSIADQVQKMKSGQRMQVELNGGEKLIGNRGAVSADHFTLDPDNHKQAARELNYTDVRTVKTKWTRTTKWLIALGIYGLVTLLGSQV
jgi:hypothetical protein